MRIAKGIRCQMLNTVEWILTITWKVSSGGLPLSGRTRKYDYSLLSSALYFSLSTMATIGYGTSDYYFGDCWTPFILVLIQVFSAISPLSPLDFCSNECHGDRKGDALLSLAMLLWFEKSGEGELFDTNTSYGSLESLKVPFVFFTQVVLDVSGGGIEKTPHHWGQDSSVLREAWTMSCVQ